MVTPYPPKPDGIGEHTHRLVGALRDVAGVDVEVLTASARRNDRRASGPERPPAHRVLSVDPRSVREASRVLRSSDPDVVHVQFAVPALGLAGLGGLVAASRLRRATGAPVVVTLHEVRRELDLLGGAGRLVHRALVRTADVVVVHTDEARGLVVGACGADPDRVVVTPLGALPPRHGVEAPSDPVEVRSRYGFTDRPTALCLGYLHPDKGIEHAIRALGRGDLDVDLLVAGAVRPRSGLFRVFERADREYERLLRRETERLGLSDRVRFAGFVPAADVPGLFELARLVVVPCTKVTQSSVLGQATASGVPVVASDLPGLRDGLGGGGLLVAPGDPAALATAIRAVVDDDELASDLAGRQRQRAAEIDLGAVAATLRDLYRDLVEQRSHDLGSGPVAVIGGG